MPSILCLALAACGGEKTAHPAIGLNIELTGDIPSVGASSRNAAQLFFEQLNAAGGAVFASGRGPIDLVIEDNGAKEKQAESVTQILVARRPVVAMIGPNSSTCANPAARIAETLKCVMLSPWSTDPATTLDAASGVPKRYVFRGCFTDPSQARVLAKFAREKLGAKRAAVLHEAGAEAVAEQVALFRETFTAAGGEVVASESYTGGVREIGPQLAKISAAAPDVVFLPAYYLEVAPVISQARKLGITATFLGTDAWSMPGDIVRRGGADVNGSYFASHFDVSMDTPEARKFVADYTARYSQPPDAVAALTYDACGLMVKALEKAGKAERESVREALSQTADYRGVTGQYTFEPGSGDPLKTTAIMQLKDGQVVWIENAGP